MIDRQQFDRTFKQLDKKTIVRIIGLFTDQYPQLIKILEQNMADHDLVQVKFHAHKLKGSLLQFCDPVSSGHAGKMEEAVKENMEEGLPQMFLELKVSSGQLLEELLVMKEKLTS